MGDNFFVYLLFDCITTVLGRVMLKEMCKEAFYSKLVEDALAKGRIQHK